MFYRLLFSSLLLLLPICGYAYDEAKEQVSYRDAMIEDGKGVDISAFQFEITKQVVYSFRSLISRSLVKAIPVKEEMTEYLSRYLDGITAPAAMTINYLGTYRLTDSVSIHFFLYRLNYGNWLINAFFECENHWVSWINVGHLFSLDEEWFGDVQRIRSRRIVLLDGAGPFDELIGMGKLYEFKKIVIKVNPDGVVKSIRHGRLKCRDKLRRCKR